MKLEGVVLLRHRDRLLSVVAGRLPQLPRPAKRALKYLVSYEGERDRYGRELFFDLARRFADGLLADGQDGAFLVSTRDQAIGRKLFVDGSFHGEHLRKLLELLDEFGLPWRGGSFLDVGAHIGTTSIALLNEGFARGYAFEPEPTNYRLLRANLALNDVQDKCETTRLALSNSEGVTSMQIDYSHHGDHRVFSKAPNVDPLGGEDKRGIQRVQCRTLDSLVEEGAVDPSDLSLIWIDVQGHEASVLAGAQNLLQRSVPLFSEYWPHGLRIGSSLDEFEAIVARYYRSFIDVRKSNQNGRTKLRPTAQIAALRREYDFGRGWQQTDLLFLNRDPDEVG